MMRKMAHIGFILKISIVFLIIMQGVFSSCDHRFNTTKNICGFWGIYVDSSYVNRSVAPDFVGNTIDIDNKGVKLPRIYHPIIVDDSMSTEEKQKKKQERNALSKKESEGSWDVIGSTPDSVIFIAPNHPLSGRYKVHIFQEDFHEYMILSNDSTYLFCYRAGY